MSRLKSLAERQADQAKARERLAELARKFAAQPVGRKQQPPKPKAAPSARPAQLAPTRPERPWAKIRAGAAPLTYLSRAANEPIAPQPWAKELVSTLLAAADQGGVTLCLVWPAKLTSLPLLHGLANIERVFAKDLRGMRTLLYPGTHACRAPLHSVVANRELLSAFYRSLWVQDNGSFDVKSCTVSPAFLAALWALNDLSQHNPDSPDPSLAELIPTFIFDPTKRTWTTTVSNPLERSLAKVEHRALRRDLRDKVSLEWDIPDKAPGALMVVHHTAKKGAWRTALTATALKGEGRPEVFLLDATDAAARTNYAAVKRIPDFLSFARESGFSDKGAVIVTDDPKTFFALRAQLGESKVTLSTKVWAAEAEEALLSAHPVAPDWNPAQRNNSNFSVSIVDRDASQLALAFQRLAASADNEESPAHQALLQACIYILRLSNMPAGYTELTAVSAEAGESDYSSRQNAWTPVKLALVAALASGALNQMRDSVERAIARAEKLIDDWNDATPMASRMLAEVRKHAVIDRKGISLVLPSSKYVLLAHRFLERKLGNDWSTAEAHIEWHTLSAVGKTLTGDRKGKHFAFVGINPDVFRVLVTHPEVPHGTVVLVAYRQAESTLKTLTSMKEIEAFKAYRGRIGLLALELERRLAEVPNPLVIGRLREISLAFKFDENGHNTPSSEQTYFKFELEGGGLAYASGWVYRYAPDEDPLFRRMAAGQIEPGDFIFDLSDELRAKLESSLQLNGDASSVVDPVRMLLKLYHEDVQRRCALLFKSTNRSALAREIHAKMVELDHKAAECRPSRVYYWLAPQAKEGTRAHASQDAKYFKVFCKALGINDEVAEQHWGFVRNARRLNQYLGRELAARYAEILFQPESAAVYRKVPEAVIRTLQQEALRYVYRVERVVPPPARVTTSKKGETNAYPQ
ncbi:hypothetical protein L0Y81_26230 [Burkholderia multivorans]|uniref:hypothetical protein n=1 Tax=Burkholderia multivorans TaxID=87883 RepID=UPI00158E343E|nr:hypothetical protein [Burkholderia multivorans]MCL4644633.1 hypothetical protein [Burkholderia multivorans]UQN88230.1 hypothetical protein L0Y85_26230 [Burkholderia multivorans]UQO73420.1 hypothetical protein L0Y81_26230 [Burkholderia multivorans]UQP27681.1 hypothetical protein L0Y89_26225 [Burkholderia multivorans]UQP39373.1 hypothetical protein L0Z03_10895 [Burkholderia multivorans]